MDGTDVREQGLTGEAEETQTASNEAAGNAAEQELDGASLMEQFLSDPSHDYKTLKYGDVMEGIVMHKDREELLVDIGSKAEGIVPAKEYSSLSDEEKEQLAVGDRISIGDAGPYTMVKKNWFNGIHMPAIAVRELDGSVRLVRDFSYDDYVSSLS